MCVLLGLMIPFLGTALGSAMVFFIKNKMSSGLQKLLLGFASGVMIAASVWSLLIPAISLAGEQGKVAWVPATVGFLLGILFFLALNGMMSHLRIESAGVLGARAKSRKRTMLVLAVTLHNIPEGMAVGVTFAGAMIGDMGITMAGAFALALGIAIQNFPEGAIISLPLCSEDISKMRAFFYGAMSGIVEPLGAVITILFIRRVVSVLPYFLSFAAGAMLYVVVEELIPELKQGEEDDSRGTIGVAVGFALMMILDVALG